MVITDFKSAVDTVAANFATGSTEWTAVSANIADHFLGCVPPLAWKNNRFACGEAYDFNDSGEPVYYCFRNIDHARNFAGCRICSIRELHGEPATVSA
jgi:hypothetical protein